MPSTLEPPKRAVLRLRHGRILCTCQHCGISWITTTPPKRCTGPARHEQWTQRPAARRPDDA
jgi:hypothetical protein